MLQCTPMFLTCTGPAPSSRNFIDLVDSEAADDFILQVQEFVNTRLYEPDAQHEGCKVRLKSRTMDSRVLGYEAHVQFAMDELVGHDDGIVLALTLSNITS